MIRSWPHPVRRTSVLVVALAVTLALFPGLSAAEASEVGYRAHAHLGGSDEVGGAPTESKPESKLWFHDGVWWAVMLSDRSGNPHTVHRLDGQEWTDTGTVVHGTTGRADVLLHGNTAYVATRNPGQLARLVYTPGAQAGGGTWTMASGFPVATPVGATPAVTVARDTTGTLWLTWFTDSRPHLSRSTDDGRTWSAATVVPVSSDATRARADDIAAVTAFQDATGPAIGIMWSNQRTARQQFAVHRDGDAPGTWSLETALAGSREADDHINLKTLGGSVYAAVKTGKKNAHEPLIRLLERKPNGAWVAHPVARVDELDTRPIAVLEIDATTGHAYVFMSRDRADGPSEIVYKRTPLSGVDFDAPAVPFIRANRTANNATSAKDPATAESGVLVLATTSRDYWWNRLGGGGTPPPDPDPDPPTDPDPDPPTDPDPDPPTGDITHAQVVTGTTAGGTTVTTDGPVAAADDAVYLASIATRLNATVTDIDGLGLDWGRVAIQCAGRNQTGLELWVATGSPASAGTVTATIDRDRPAAMTITRYDGVDTAAPIVAAGGANSNGVDGSCSGGTDSASYAYAAAHGTDAGHLHAAATMRNRTHTPTAGLTERADIAAGSGGSTTSVAVLDGPPATTATTPINGRFSGATDWAVLHASLRPRS